MRFLLLSVLLWYVALPAMGAPPNVLIVLTDDQGWGDLSLHGNRNVSTPHLDSLARDGAAFDSFYVCSVCAPTRAEFLTGRYYPKTGVSGVSRGEGRLNADETTIADLFHQAGYATGAFGKWHNGTQAPYHPLDRGFDEFYGFTSGHWGHYFSPPLDHNRRRVRGRGYVVDDFTNHAIDFIKQHRTEPFFCYVPFNTPHSPMMVEDRFYEKFADAEIDPRYRDPSREDLAMTRAALAMVENIDWNVGRLLETLRQHDLEENTIVVFFSDNGPNSYRFNGGMKGRKGSIEEGGLRSPLFIRWPDHIEPGRTIQPIAGAIDLLPTLLDLAGIEARPSKPIDGKSLKPLLMRRGSGDRETPSAQTPWKPRRLFAIRRDQVSVRTERFRLDGSGRLFDITVDRGQRNDVADQHPKLTQELKKAADAHGDAMQQHFERYADRPFTVGYAKTTVLPARDGIPHGSIQRSSKAPNNSFFEHWTHPDDAITWDVQIGQAGVYEAIVHYTCQSEDVGVTIQLTSENDESHAAAPVTEAFDPPLYDKSKERVEKSHYFVKDFKPLSLGTLHLEKGRSTFRLTARQFKGDEAIDVHSIELVRRNSGK